MKSSVLIRHQENSINFFKKLHELLVNRANYFKALTES
jgi:hypothetical protein